MTTDPQPLPPVAAAWLAHITGPLGIGAVHLTAYAVVCINGEHNKEGLTTTTPMYDVAEMLIRRDLADPFTPTTARLILHEALHVVLAEHGQMERFVLDRVPESERGNAAELLDYATEHAVERLAHSLYPVLAATFTAEGTP